MKVIATMHGCIHNNYIAYRSSYYGIVVANGIILSVSYMLCSCMYSSYHFMHYLLVIYSTNYIKPLSFLAMVEASRVEVIAQGVLILANEFSLFCSVLTAESLQPSLSYRWLKNDEQLMSQSSVLSFDSVGLSDIAEYKCEVTLSSSLQANDVTIISEGYQLVFNSKIDLLAWIPASL